MCQTTDSSGRPFNIWLDLQGNNGFTGLNEKNPNRILIIRLSSLGDVLLSSPLIRALKNQFNGVKIDFLVRSEYADAVKFNPNINIVYAISRSDKTKYLMKILKENRYDFLLDLQNNIRSRLICRSINVKTYPFRKPNLQKYLLVKFKINRFKEIKPITRRYAESLPGLKLDDKGLEFFVPLKVHSTLDSSKKYIGLCPGSKHFTKRWPPEFFVELGNSLSNMGYRILVFGGRDDKTICESVSSGISGSLNLSNDNDLFQTAADMKNCKLIVCNDSGLMHTAAASGIPVVSIFGSSVKEFGFIPYGAPNLILENNSLSCRPCSHIGRSRCPEGHFKCMREITPGFVTENVTKFLSGL